ncbi:NAD(P)-dependent oxidoreductase [Sphaerisporangium aureirubrum]|uniref:NAD(P)-dependent oxidoreductase n=1 Tax=Sphaerisporangium aureirubrum TaxID=1544736 RepID=A0ABW1NM23_9ACTN
MKISVAQGAIAVLDQFAVRLRGEADFVTGPVDTPAQVAELTAGADALVVTLHRLDEPHFAAMADSVRVIGRAGVGLDTIDLDAAARHGVAVVHQPAYATGEVATHAMAMLLSLQRRLSQSDALVRRDGWGGAADIGPIFSLDDAAVAVLGCGRIGRAVVDRLVPFVREVRVFDPLVTEPVPGARMVADLGELLDDAEALSLHVPLTPETRHVIGRREIRRMRPGALIVNVSRGGLVDEEELALALADGHLAGAGLDVFETEPLPGSSPLRTAPNLLFSPHNAWNSGTAARRLAEWTIADVISYATRREAAHGRMAVEPAVPRLTVVPD